MGSMHIDELNVEKFRGLSGVTLGGLGRVNLLVGLNSSGKTSLLEAIEVACRPAGPLPWIGLSRRRYPESEIGQVEALKWLFPQRPAPQDSEELYRGEIGVSMSGTYPLRHCRCTLEEIEGSVPPEQRGAGGERVRDRLRAFILRAGEGPQRGVRGHLSLLFSGGQAAYEQDYTIWSGEPFVAPSGPQVKLRVASIAPFSHRLERIQVQQLSQASMEGWREQVTTLLRQIDPDVEALEILDPLGTRAGIYVRHRRAGLAPLGALGDGVRRALMYALGIVRAREGVILIDELETAIHVSALGPLFGWLLRGCLDNDIQLFASTHSLEALDALLAAARPDVEHIVAYRLGTEGRVKRFSGSLLDDLRSELGQDIRGTAAEVRP